MAGADRGDGEAAESRGAALAASALLAAAIHGWLLFGVRIHGHEPMRGAPVVEVSLVATPRPIGAPVDPGPEAAPRPAAPPPPAPAAPPKPRVPVPKAAPKAKPEIASTRTDDLPTPAPEGAPEATAPGPPTPDPAASPAGSGSGAAVASSTGDALARPRYRSNPAPPYPPAARRRGQEGVVLLAVRVSASGRPEAVEVRLSSGFAALDAAAVAAVREWEFEPGRVGGVPVPSQVEVPIHFELDRE